MVELMIGLVALVVLFVVIVQLTGFTDRDGNHVPGLFKRHTDSMVTARERAALAIISDTPPGTIAADPPLYIESWKSDYYARGHSANTTPGDPVPGNAADLHNTIVRRSVEDQADWDYIRESPTDDLVLLYDNPASIESYFGLARGFDSEEIPLIDAARALLEIEDDSIDVESEVWMTWLKGIY